MISLCSSWVIYEHKQYTGNLYVLSEGDYPNLTSMGCPPGFAIRSIKAVPMVRKSLELKTRMTPPCIPLLWLTLNLRLSPSRRSQFPPSLCSASSAWRAERSPRTQRSSTWLRRASTTTSCPSESTEAGKCRNKWALLKHPCGRLLQRNSDGQATSSTLIVSVSCCSWVICEHGNFRGRQFLLEPIEITNWLKFSSLQTVGSMFPIRQVC